MPAVQETCWRQSSVPGLRISPGGENGNLLQYSCLENPHGQRSLAVYSSWDCQELDTTERLNNTQAVVAAHALQGAVCWAGPCGAAVLWALVGGPFFLLLSFKYQPQF